MLTDTHCHLDLEKFDPDRAAVLERARQAGVARILIPSMSVTSSRAVLRLAESDPMLYAAVGIHPTEASGIGDEALAELRNLAGHPKVKAIGEIGLDYYWDAAPSDIQQIVLKEQLALARDLSLPVVIHLREKEDLEQGSCALDLLRILEEWGANSRSNQDAGAGRRGVLHSFAGSLETARAAIGLGFYIGVTGPITYKKAAGRRQVVAALPLDRLLIETDAPFQAPEPQRGKRNEPAFVTLITDIIADIHSTTREQVARITTANAARLFGWGG
jgi:TatD DNase family protein